MVELPTAREFDSTAKSALLLFVLQSRQQNNVNMSVLKALEESASFDELPSFFTSNSVKNMIKVIVKHYSQLVKKRIVKQKEAELLIQGAVINFECSNVEAKLINQCIIDSLIQVIANEGKPESRKGNAPDVDTYNQQFNLNANNNGQFFVQKKSKLYSSNASQ